MSRNLEKIKNNCDRWYHGLSYLIVHDAVNDQFGHIRTLVIGHVNKQKPYAFMLIQGRANRC